MKTGCKDCDHIQAKIGDKTKLCDKCELQHLSWLELRIKRRRKRIMSERTKIELEVENETHKGMVDSPD